MKILVVSCVHALRMEDGAYYVSSVEDYTFFLRYLDVFDEVKVVLRTRPIASVENTTDTMLLLNGPNLSVCELPHFRGLKGFVRIIPKAIMTLFLAVKDCDAILCRVPGFESFLAFFVLYFTKKPTALEVVADPATLTQLNGLWGMAASVALKWACSKANGVSYVTEKYLQQKYTCKAMRTKCSNRFFTAHYSSVNLPSSAFMAAREYNDTLKSIRLIIVSNAIHDNAKGHMTFIEVIHRLSQQGYQVDGVCVGDGVAVEYFKKYADLLGIGNKITFTGLISQKAELIEWLKKSDIMLFPTQSEGLPRVVIEAAAVGLPVLSTPVGGIPELLNEAYMFRFDDVDGFSAKIGNLMQNGSELSKMSVQNITMATQYKDSILRKKRMDFYTHLKQLCTTNPTK